MACACYSNSQHPEAGGFETHPQLNSPALWLLAVATQQTQHYNQRESSSGPVEAGVTVIMVQETLRPQLLRESNIARTIYTYGIQNDARYSRPEINYL